MPTQHWVGKEKVVKYHHEVPFKTLWQEYMSTAPEGTPAFLLSMPIMPLRQKY